MAYPDDDKKKKSRFRQILDRALGRGGKVREETSTPEERRESQVPDLKFDPVLQTFIFMNSGRSSVVKFIDDDFNVVEMSDQMKREYILRVHANLGSLYNTTEFAAKMRKWSLPAEIQTDFQKVNSEHTPADEVWNLLVHVKKDLRPLMGRNRYGELYRIFHELDAGVHVMTETDLHEQLERLFPDSEQVEDDAEFFAGVFDLEDDEIKEAVEQQGEKVLEAVQEVQEAFKDKEPVPDVIQAQSTLTDVEVKEANVNVPTVLILPTGPRETEGVPIGGFTEEAPVQEAPVETVSPEGDATTVISPMVDTDVSLGSISSATDDQSTGESSTVQEGVPQGALQGQGVENTQVPAKYHREAITVFFNDADAPKWDNELNANIDKANYSSSDALAIMKAIVDKEGFEILVLSVKTSGDIQEFKEIMQLHFSLKRQMARGGRVPSVGISLGSLMDALGTGKVAPDTGSVPGVPPTSVPQSDKPKTDVPVNLSKSWYNRPNWFQGHGPQYTHVNDDARRALEPRFFQEAGPGMFLSNVPIYLRVKEDEHEDC